MAPSSTNTLATRLAIIVGIIVVALSVLAALGYRTVTTGNCPPAFEETANADSMVCVPTGSAPQLEVTGFAAGPWMGEEFWLSGSLHNLPPGKWYLWIFQKTTASDGSQHYLTMAERPTSPEQLSAGVKTLYASVQDGSVALVLATPEASDYITDNDPGAGAADGIKSFTALPPGAAEIPLSIELTLPA